MVYKTGEKPGEGNYICKCGKKIVLDDTTDTLPQCRRCNGSEFRKA